MKTNTKPKHFKVLKILGFTFLIVGIVLIVLSATVFARPFAGSTIPNEAVLIPGVFLVFFCSAFFMLGFQPELQKMGAKSARHIAEQNKEEYKDLANTAAYSSKDAVSTIVKAVRQNNKIHCKFCGSQIDSDSVFCSQCGKKVK